MRPITISLSSETWETAKEMDNFSRWVRNQLRWKDRYSDLQDEIKDLEAHLEDSKRIQKHWFDEYNKLKVESEGEDV